MPPPVMYATLFLKVFGGNMGVLMALKNLAFSAKLGWGIPDSESDCSCLFYFKSLIFKFKLKNLECLLDIYNSK